MSKPSLADPVDPVYDVSEHNPLKIPFESWLRSFDPSFDEGFLIFEPEGHYRDILTQRAWLGFVAGTHMSAK
jgi:hypothetical protein